ncbi:Ribosomal protein S18 acetylase RimI [Devosia enhydra]|uniref:Ribosomal protein S18 acetylase RimI n=1 Tax=Devosia enhydra TaxID=665118 RepID=A0A1K2HYB5_9HYPH|nr:GNAT family N-acetyltransferase [Devosia enhydra]SFZ84804.1 Ribosomal protein S18 acetylase RimI [Devosia enhydra]
MAQSPAFVWRPMAADDLPAIQAIADRVHPDFFEAPAVLAEKFALAPEGCRVLEAEAGGLAGYVFSHPWLRGAVPALNAPLGGLPETADCWYIHDLALLPQARGSGAAGRCIADLVALAQKAGMARISLVAVNGSIPFWSRQGFGVVDAPHLAPKLAAYEAAARLMERPVG